MSTFKVGDRVRWTSQAGGYTRAKVGVVERIVPPKGQAGLKVTQFCQRDHESYIVRVNGRGLYWPLVSKLELDAPNEMEAIRASLAAAEAKLADERKHADALAACIAGHKSMLTHETFCGLDGPLYKEACAMLAAHAARRAERDGDQEGTR